MRILHILIISFLVCFSAMTASAQNVYVVPDTWTAEGFCNPPTNTPVTLVSADKQTLADFSKSSVLSFMQSICTFGWQYPVSSLSFKSCQEHLAGDPSTYDCIYPVTYQEVSDSPPPNETGWVGITIFKVCSPAYSYLDSNLSCRCIDGALFNQDVNKCVGAIDRRHARKPLMCDKSIPGMGEPIFPTLGVNRQQQPLNISVGGVPLALRYDSSQILQNSSGGAGWIQAGMPGFGVNWNSNFNKQAIFYSTKPPTAIVEREFGEWVTFLRSNGNYVGDPDVNDTFADGVNYFDGSTNSVDVFQSDGTLNNTVFSDGRTLLYSISNKQVLSIKDQFGRSVTMSFISGNSGSRIGQIVAADGGVTGFEYDSATGNLVKIDWPDGAALTYLYENSSLPGALTGIIDESGSRYATYSYSTDGSAVGTQLANGVLNYSTTYSAIHPSYTVSVYYDSTLQAYVRDFYWANTGSLTVSQPSGATIQLATQAPVSTPLLSMQSQPNGSGCAAATSSLTYDGRGNALSEDDFNGNRACYSYDSTRNVRTVTLKGLAASGAAAKACPSNLSSYVPNAADAAHPERKTTTVWHPDWVLKTQEAEPKKITTWVYNGQPDPIVGGTASCAPSTATLPDGKPIAVLCNRYEQATTDSTGALGVSAAVTGATRAWSFTYNQYGQVLTATTPKMSSTDMLSHTTTYTYYSTTRFSGAVGQTMGDLQTVTNPLGQVTSYTAYDAAGRLLSSTDANGTVTTQTYSPRGWLLAQTVTPATGSALTTTYTYYPTGLLQTATLPDATSLSYAYDDAHRLTDVTDGAGNHVHYVLDNVGNRTSEQFSDASGHLASTITRVFDALNRVQSTTGLLQ